MTTGAAAEGVMDSGEKRLNELGYKQELRREMVRFPTPLSLSLSLAIFLRFPFLYARNSVLVFGFGRPWTVPSSDTHNNL
jgi:hypothetical protein